MAEIRLRDGTTVLIDDEDVALASKRYWHRSGFKGRYAGSKVRVDGKRTTLYLHRLIVGAPDGVPVDHRNGDTFDNRRANLRTVTASQNQQNRNRLNANNTSGARGVYWSQRHQKYRAAVEVHGCRYSLGYYENVEDAAQAAAKGRQRLMTHASECSQPVAQL